MEIDRAPDLDAPNLIAAFEGWNDAGQAATTAVRYLIDTWHAKAFARLDPEEYFSFTDTRPTVRIVDGQSREVRWPRIEFYWRKNADPVADAILMPAPEPNLKWRTFCGEVIELARSLGARRIVTLGALVTDAVHTRPVPLTGFATDDAVQQKFAARQITRSSYEGPTGIVGVLHDACRKAEMPAVSLWGSSPYYLGATPNPKTALGLLDALDDALTLGLNLEEMRAVAGEFTEQVSRAVRENAEIQEQIRVLEERYDERGEQQRAPAPEFPPTGAIIADLENFLRKQREDESGA
ncbi:MAG: PAC2 family protein [Dehalococcoidia bacterium]|nr:PAC2 family protein [Dehalococcoidia bacterium]